MSNLAIFAPYRVLLSVFQLYLECQSGTEKALAMMDATEDMMKLYSKRILALAAEIPLTERLDAPDATAKRRSPLCGSTVTVDIKVKDGKISEFGQDVKACALGQTSASILGANVIGLSAEEITRGRDQLPCSRATKPFPMPLSQSWKCCCQRKNTPTDMPLSFWPSRRRLMRWPLYRKTPDKKNTATRCGCGAEVCGSVAVQRHRHAGTGS
jgi:hypothetical protein